MTNYTITITSDTVCPWCYVGLRRLQSAINTHQSTYPSDKFTTTWLPFYLNPDSPAPGIDKQAVYAAKFGAQRTQMMQAHLSRLAAPLGIKFAFGGKTGNTRDSHRVIALAHKKGGPELQNRVVEEFFRAYFEVNEDISDREVLVRWAAKAGMMEKEVRTYLESGEGGEQVDREVAMAKRRFVGGVPDFVVNERYEVQGAEEPDAFLDIFERIRKESGSADGGVVAKGESC
ncbi:hypothetical protein MBLNU457_7388t1 [Dothideomycetes sp. NU457]